MTRKSNKARQLTSVAFALLLSSTSFASVIDKAYIKADSLVIIFGASDFIENGGVAPIVYDFYLLNGVSSGQIGNDIIAADGRTINYNTQRYNPIQNGEESGWEYQINNATFGGNFISATPHQTLDGNDAYTAFGMDETTDVDLLGGGGRASRFYVASNVPFDIYAMSQSLQATGDFSSMSYDNIRYRLRYQVSGGGGANRWGRAAQDPSIGGSGIVIGDNNSYTLDDISAGPTKVFDGGRRTARARGSIMDHAVSFQSRYNLRGSTINGNNYDLSLGTGTLSAEVVYTVYAP